ncbi:hypothetical protein J9B02_26750, partial [Klebsiella pneumoniae]
YGHGACVEQDDKGWDARKRAYCLKIQPATGSFARNLIYSTKPVVRTKSYLFNKAVITLHGDVLMWLMNTLLILGYVNKRWVGHIEYYMTIKHYQ